MASLPWLASTTATVVAPSAPLFDSSAWDSGFNGDQLYAGDELTHVLTPGSAAGTFSNSTFGMGSIIIGNGGEGGHGGDGPNGPGPNG